MIDSGVRMVYHTHYQIDAGKPTQDVNKYILTYIYYIIYYVYILCINMHV